MNNLEMVNLDTYLNYLLIFVTNIANIDFKTYGYKLVFCLEMDICVQILVNSNYIAWIFTLNLILCLCNKYSQDLCPASALRNFLFWTSCLFLYVNFRKWRIMEDYFCSQKWMVVDKFWTSYTMWDTLIMIT